jgi:hypothetical protein
MPRQLVTMQMQKASIGDWKREIRMNSRFLQLTAAAMLTFLVVLADPATKGQTVQTKATLTSNDGPTYTANGELKKPEHYREWIFLTSGIDMSYDVSATVA